MIDLVSRRLLYFVLSGVVILVGLFALALSPGLRWGIEFSSGVMVSASFSREVTELQVRGTLASLGYDDAIVQGAGGGSGFLLRVRADADLDPQSEKIRAALTSAHGELLTFEFNAVSPIIAQDTVRNGAITVVAAVIGILLYVTWAFRHVPRPFRYGVCAVIALAHDVLVVIGVTSLLANFIPLEVSTMYLVGLLTVLGYSVNDTIVVFDRLRENVLKGVARDFPTAVNFSLLETLGRSLNTSLTTLLVLSALIILGPATIRDFIIVLTVGVVSGTYSSIFIASQLLVAWETRSLGTLTGRPVPVNRSVPRGGS